MGTESQALGRVAAIVEKKFPTCPLSGSPGCATTHAPNWRCCCGPTAPSRSAKTSSAAWSRRLHSSKGPSYRPRSTRPRTGRPTTPSGPSSGRLPRAIERTSPLPCRGPGEKMTLRGVELLLGQQDPGQVLP